MRKLNKNGIITVRALKQYNTMLYSDQNIYYQIIPDDYVRCIPDLTWMYWILKKENAIEYTVKRIIK